jgi:hypothetical protein
MTVPRRTILFVNDIGGALTVEASGETQYFSLIKEELGRLVEGVVTHEKVSLL